jgi:hypothetical protein
LKGSGSNSVYGFGRAVVRHSEKTFFAGGNLYFVTYGPKFKEVQGQKILVGSVIEDTGKGEGKYVYKTKGNVYDLADLDSATKDVSFDSSRNIITGSANSVNNSNFIYKFNTIYPFKKVKIMAQQADIDFSPVSLSYSLDGKNWQSIPSFIRNEVLVPKYEIGQFETFNLTLSTDPPNSEIFLKIEPTERTDERKKYGIKNLEIEAELIMK